MEGPPYRDTVPFARMLHEAAPDRCVWGSDWPHVSHWGTMMNVGDLLDLLADWVPDDKARQPGARGQSGPAVWVREFPAKWHSRNSHV